MFGYDVEDTRFVIDANTGSDMNTRWYYNGLEQEKSDEFIKFCIPLKVNMVKNMMNPLKVLQISRFETVYLMAQILWSVNGKIDKL